MPPTEPDIGPIALLGRRRGKEPAFLDAHHLEAARRIQRLFERSRLRPRTTMHYGERVGGGSRMAGEEITDMAADARSRLARLIASLPSECAGVVIDVCGFEKGLQDVEAERGWPRRSAKLVLRIGLDALARQAGLCAGANGPEEGRMAAWLGAGARPGEFG